MYAFVLFLGLALALTVVLQVLGDLLPSTSAALHRTLGAVVAVAAAWALDYSVVTAFGADLRAAWMHPVVTGLVLVGAGELVRSLVGALGGSRGAASRDGVRTA